LASILTIMGLPPEAWAAVPAAACVPEGEKRDQPAGDSQLGRTIHIHARRSERRS
jgi:hypothetical protein